MLDERREAHTDIDPQTLAFWLEWAAMRLIAMPAGRLSPAQPRALWPDYVRDIYDNFHASPGARRLRALAPSSAEIPIVDKITLLPNLCSKVETRKVLHWRAQVHPIRGNNLLTWTWIAQRLEVRTYTAKRWHREGLDEVLEKVPRATVCHLLAFFEATL